VLTVSTLTARASAHRPRFDRQTDSLVSDMASSGRNASGRCSAPVKAGWLDGGYLARVFGEAAGHWAQAQAQLSPETYLAATSVAAALGLDIRGTGRTGRATTSISNTSARVATARPARPES
jgi:hypothetical protein